MVTDLKNKTDLASIVSFLKLPKNYGSHLGRTTFQWGYVCNVDSEQREVGILHFMIVCGIGKVI